MKPSPLSTRCKNCWKDTCLDGKLVTEENFVENTVFRSRDGKGCTRVDVDNKPWVFWDKDEDGYEKRFRFYIW